jgi:acyl-CoA thioesterase 8
MREGSGGIDLVEHSTPMPSDVEVPPEMGGNLDAELLHSAREFFRDTETPFESVRCKVAPGGKPYQKKLRQWLRARGRISDCPPEVRFDEESQGKRLDLPGDNHKAHLSALAYMSDSYFIGTVARTHNLRRFANRRSIESTVKSFRGSTAEKDAMREHLEKIAREEAEENEAAKAAGDYHEDDRQIGMMVSLDHTIFFHNPRAFRADQWMLAEMESPWAGDGRGLCFQRIWAKDGTLIATCTQEGLVRLQQSDKVKGSKL